MRRGFFGPLALASLLVLGVSGCTFTAEIRTDKDYDPSDGVGAEVGDLALRNLLLITNDAGEANLVMTVVNSSGEDVSLLVQFDEAGERATEELPIAGMPRLTRFGDDPAAGLILRGDQIIPGGLVPVYFQYANVPGQMVLIPVLDGSLPEYELLVP